MKTSASSRWRLRDLKRLRVALPRGGESAEQGEAARAIQETGRERVCIAVGVEALDGGVEAREGPGGVAALDEHLGEHGLGAAHPVVLSEVREDADRGLEEALGAPERALETEDARLEVVAEGPAERIAAKRREIGARGQGRLARLREAPDVQEGL